MAKQYFRKWRFHGGVRVKTFDSLEDCMNDKDSSLNAEVFSGELTLEGTITTVMVPTRVLQQDSGGKKKIPSSYDEDVDLGDDEDVG